MIDVRFGMSDDEDDFTNHYCPGKFEICCQDPDFVEENNDSANIYETTKTVGKDNESKEKKVTKVKNDSYIIRNIIMNLSRPVATSQSLHNWDVWTMTIVVILVE